MTSALISAGVAAVALTLAIVVYKTRLSGRGYEGSMKGVYTLGTVLGVLGGLGVGLATLSIVLTFRALR